MLYMLIDLTKIYKKYKGQWVAFQSDEKTVIASGATAKEAYAKAVKKGYRMPIMARMPSELTSYVGAM